MNFTYLKSDLLHEDFESDLGAKVQDVENGLKEIQSLPTLIHSLAKDIDQAELVYFDDDSESKISQIAKKVKSNSEELDKIVNNLDQYIETIKEINEVVKKKSEKIEKMQF